MPVIIAAVSSRLHGNPSRDLREKETANFSLVHLNCRDCTIFKVEISRLHFVLKTNTWMRMVIFRGELSMYESHELMEELTIPGKRNHRVNYFISYLKYFY